MICLIRYFKYGTSNLLVTIAIEQSFKDARWCYTRNLKGTKSTTWKSEVKNDDLLKHDQGSRWLHQHGVVL